jgi:hypothetical protein
MQQGLLMAKLKESSELRCIIAGDLRRQTNVPEDQIDHVIDQLLDALEKAKADGRALDEVELQLID